MYENHKLSFKWLVFLLWIVGSLTILPVNLFAAATGTIKGIMTDKETKEPVIGASVMVVGTKLGAVTDINGRYAITRVDPGTYTIKISHLEYVTQTVTDVKVQTDITTEISIGLTRKSATKLRNKIVVRAQHEIIDKYITASEVTISNETIKHQPVTTVDQLLTQVSGVITNNQGEVFVRGGRAFEVGYIVDGVPLGDPLGGLGQAGASLSLVSGSIQEFTVIKDGFDPEYGNALSGIVKITTQTGSKDATRMNMQYITDNFGNKSLNKYSRNSDYGRFSLSGPDPFFKSKLLPALGLDIIQDKELTYYFYAEVTKNDGAYQYSRYDTPVTRRRNRYFDLLGFHIPQKRYNKYYWMGNIKFRPMQNLKMIFSYKNSSTRYTLFDWAYRYSAATAPFEIDSWKSASLEVSQSVSKNMNYEMVLSFSQNGVTRKPGDPNNPGHGLDPNQFPLDYQTEWYEDRNKNGVYDPPEPVINLYPDTMDYGTDFTGPKYNLGEDSLLNRNIQGATIGLSDFRFNDNGYVDRLEGEPFIDLNGNGVWDKGDYLHDKNGNGRLDSSLISHVNNRTPEPYIDGDSVIGEPFIDLNSNHVYDPGIDIFIKSNGPDNMDYNHDGQHNGPESPWEPGIPFVDRNGNGLYDPPNNQYDLGEPFTDVNGNGVWDGGGSKTFYDPLNYDEDAIWHHRNTNTYRGEVKIFWQLGNHELKAGAALQRDDLMYQEIQKPYLTYNGRPDGGPYPDRGAFRDMFAYKPWSGTVYFRDKLEYGSMIASLGLRWDFFIQDKYALVDVARNDDLGSGIILGDREKFSP
ncbi:MAG: TonB-dependent receptor plug domain-containing protein, partial [FCB group bacterium]|nr:TonB-dependent receptor plug domain-containing protein [FCB group bacterium]